MEKKTLNDVAKELDLKVEKPKGKGRPDGAKGRWPDKKKMSKDALMKEAAINRKKIVELEDSLAKVILEAQVPVAALAPELCAVFPCMAYDYLAVRFGDHWKLNEKEAMLYGDALSRVATKYLGDLIGENQELAGLVIVVITTSLPRVLITFTAKKEQDKEEGKPNGKPGDKP